MKRHLLLVFLLVFSVPLSAEPLIEIDTMPVKKIKKIKSLALFKFDGKLINSGRINLIDYLGISDDYYRYLLKKFSNNKSLKISDTEKLTSVIEEDEINVLRGDDTPHIDTKILSTTSVFSKTPVKAIDAYLYGKINKFYEGRTFETSYIDITVYLVDSKSKVIYWTTRARGCLQYVSDALVSIITKGSYTPPASKDIERFGWVNPYRARIKNWSIGYSPGYLIMLGEIGNRIENGFIHNFTVDFKLPLWGKYNIYNQVEFTVISSFDTIDPYDSIKNNTFHTFLPLMFNFLYKPKGLINVRDLTPFVKAGLGLSLNEIYYSGLYPHPDSKTSMRTIIKLGIGSEYRFKALDLFDYRFRTDKFAVLAEITFLKWFGTDISSNALCFNLGLKYYF